MKVMLSDLKTRTIDRIVVESVDLSLYIAYADVPEGRLLIAADDGKPLKTRNLLDMKSALSKLRAAEMVLVQRSAYDEMVGQSFAPTDNGMEIPLGPGFEALPAWEH
ncbi:DUF6482 family protein [Congregibacter sp.]|uniref:DUF6482 family protein n=1 Tax=Congregibacter sp. TaxID=2744308 RepID=UPI003F6AB40C